MIYFKNLLFTGLISGVFFVFSANAQDEKTKKEDAPIGKGVEGLPKDIIKKIDESKPADLAEKLNLAINMLSREGQGSMRAKARLEFIERKMTSLENASNSNANIVKVRDLVSDPGFKKKALEMLDKPNFTDEIAKVLKDNSLTARDVVDYVQLKKVTKTKADIKLALSIIFKEFNLENPSISGIPLPNENGDFSKEVDNILASLSSKPTKPSRAPAVDSSEALKNAVKELLGAGN